MRHQRLRQLFAGAMLLAGVAGFSSAASAQTLPASCTGFTDDPIQPSVTVVKAQHIAELRACVDALRAQVSLAPAVWTDASLQPQTWIRAVHIVELRAALAAVFTARGKVPPVYTDATLTAQATLVRAVHITELREAILVVAGVCPADGCGEVVEYYHVDAIGSVRAVTDEAGAVVLRRDYFLFGEGVNPDGGTSLGFTSQEGDPESGLNYVGARYYRAWTGRFTAVDPVFAGVSNPQNWNRYAYALNNPLVYVDPTGLVVCLMREDKLICYSENEPIGDRTPSGGGGGGGGGNRGGAGGGGHDGDGPRDPRDPRNPGPQSPDPGPPGQAPPGPQPSPDSPTPAPEGGSSARQQQPSQGSTQSQESPKPANCWSYNFNYSRNAANTSLFVVFGMDAKLAKIPFVPQTAGKIAASLGGIKGLTARTFGTVSTVDAIGAFWTNGGWVANLAPGQVMFSAGMNVALAAAGGYISYQGGVALGAVAYATVQCW